MNVALTEKNSRIPIWIKLGYSAFLIGHLVLNLGFYGPMNYLWFCDIAVLTTTIALWTENRLLMSMTAVSLFGPSALWVVDLLYKLITHRDLMGWTSYMEDPNLPRLLRLASTFHLWLPMLLMFCIYRLGYDRRALWYQTAFAVGVLILSRLISDPPPAHSIHHVVNVNGVYGNSDIAPQTKLPTWLYIGKIIVKSWIGMYLPSHLLLRFAFRKNFYVANERALN